MFFHKDSAHKYTFDELAIPKGAMYGMTNRRSNDGADKEVTARDLVAIQSALAFQKHTEDVSEVFYKYGGRGSCLEQGVAYNVALCVVSIK